MSVDVWGASGAPHVLETQLGLIVYIVDDDLSISSYIPLGRGILVMLPSNYNCSNAKYMEARSEDLYKPCASTQTVSP